MKLPIHSAGCPVRGVLAAGVLLLFLVPAGSALAQAADVPPSRLSAREVAFSLRYGRKAKGVPAPRSKGFLFSRDKVFHFTISGAWTGTTYVGLAGLAGWPHGWSLGVSAGSAAALGVLKEAYDASRIGGRASGGDLVADALGIGLAVGIIVAL